MKLLAQSSLIVYPAMNKSLNYIRFDPVLKLDN